MTIAKTILLGLLLTMPMAAQSTRITAANIADVGGNPVTGYFCVQPAQPFVRGGGGNVVPTEACFGIAAGVLQSNVTLADTSLTNPANVCYRVTIKNWAKQVLAQYACMQPSGSTYSFDDFVQAAPPYITTSFTVPQFSFNGTPLPNTINIVGSGVSYSANTLTFNGGGSSLNWQGAWSGSTAYAVGAAVSYLGSSYVALIANTNVLPTNATDWALIAQVGATGAAGATGQTGAQGPTGNTGATGPQGTPGTTGATGATGSAGAAATIAVGTTTTGAAGSSASVSNSGSSNAAVFDFTIPRGDTGATGATGSQGPKGDTGSTGPQGPSGGSTNWRGAWSSSASYAIYDAVSYSGSSYIAIAAGTNEQPDTHSADWQLLAQAGATGATGATGPQGTAGATGATGSAGAAATIAVGTVTPLAAGATPTVANGGSSSAAVFNFGIPAGATGATGATGPTGTTGATGATGPTGPNAVSTSTTTALNCVLKGNATNVACATAGTDYQAALGYTPAHSGANSDITSLTGLSTLLTAAQGGTGAIGAGYAYANGSSPYTFSTTIPYGSLSGAPTLQPTAGGNLTWTNPGGVSGNPTPSLVIPAKLWSQAAECNNATAGSSWNLPTSAAPTPACLTQSNTQQAVLGFADGNSAQFSFSLPSDWSSAAGFQSRILFSSTATSGTVIFNVALSCTAPGAADNTAFNTATAYATITQSSAGVLQAPAASSITSTGCAAGSFAHVKITRATDTASDTAVAVRGVELTFGRTM